MKLQNPTGHKHITIESHENFQIFLEDFDSGSRTFELIVELKGKNAVCEIQGRVQVLNSNQKKWTIRQIFSHENQKGKIDLKGTAEGQSILEFDGSAILKPKSKNTEVQLNERIILFDKAKAKAMPVLTVKTDDVKKASHAASITPIEKDKILYCASRGLGRKEALAILKKGFLT